MNETLPPTATMLAIATLITLVLLWPTKRPYVTRKGSTVTEHILVLRAPAYWARSWYVRWTPGDGIFARAYCYNPEESSAYRAASAIME